MFCAVVKQPKNSKELYNLGLIKASQSEPSAGHFPVLR
jgi:hypothetical protein